MKLDIAYCAERLKCAKEEKRDCFETVRLLARACRLVREKGVLAVEGLRADMAKNGGAFFTECMEYLADGLTDEQLESVYARLLAAGDYRGGTFLRNVLIAEGLIVANGAGGTEQNLLPIALIPWFGAGWGAEVRRVIRDENTRALY